jgi:hypothetical protein
VSGLVPGMTGVTPGLTDVAPAAAPPGVPGRRGRGRRGRGRVAAMTVAALVAAGIGAGVTSIFRPNGHVASAAGNAGQATTTPVTRQTVSQDSEVDATLGYAGGYTVTGHGAGTITWLPGAGAVVREGGVLYRVDNGTPVFLLYGKVPAWRPLAEGMTGEDVAELNYDLVVLGYADTADIAGLGWDYFGWDTKYALEQLQSRLGLTVTGALPMGQAVFEPSAIMVTALSASLGSPAAGPILTATSTSRVVTISLSTAQETEVRAGDQVTIVLPDGQDTPGTVSSVGTVATSSGTGSSTVPVVVTLADPAAAGRLDQAPVLVEITAASVSDVLAVPVDALLALAGGGYAVEEVTASGRHHLVPVSLGLFDDASGIVQVTGPGLAAGQRVVVPSI